MQNKNQKLLIERLHEIQDKNSYISETEIINLAKEFKKSPTEIYEAISFYRNFYLEKPKAKVIKMCQSLTCHMLGNETLLSYVSKLLNIEIGKSNNKVSLETVPCIGLCDMAPAMLINDKEYTKLTKDKIRRILKKEGVI